MNDELKKLYDADLYEHAHAPGNGTAEYRKMRDRDRQRRQQVAMILTNSALKAPWKILLSCLVVALLFVARIAFVNNDELPE